MSVLRSRKLSARVVEALSVACTAGLIAAAPGRAAAAEPPAAAPPTPQAQQTPPAQQTPQAEPTQQELLRQIEALRAKVERLEASQTQPTAQPGTAQATTAPSFAVPVAAPATEPAERSASDQVRADSESRSQMLQNSGNFTAGYNKGKFVIQDEAGNFVFHPQLQLQFRFVANDRNDGKHDGNDDDFQSGFEVRRAKFGFDGNMFSPNFTYLFLWATDRNTGNPVLEEAWGKYAFQTGSLKDFYVKGGQFKDPFVHEALTSSKKLLAVERSLINDVFVGGDDFVQGVSVGWDDGPEGLPLRAEVAYHDGVNGSNQNFQDFPTTKANFGASGRVEYLAFGKWSEYEDFTTLGNTSDLLVIGAGANFTEAGDTDTFLHTVDVQWETGRLGLYAAYLGRTNEDLKVGTGTSAHNANTYDWGFLVQAAYMLDPRVEPFARYDYINFDQAGLAAGVENRVSEITAGMNYYLKGHNAKFTVDVTYLPDGTPVADTGADILASPGEAQLLLRAQFQLLI